MQMISTPPNLQPTSTQQSAMKDSRSTTPQKTEPSSFQRLLDQRQPQQSPPSASTTSAPQDMELAGSSPQEAAVPGSAQEDLVAAFIAQNMVIFSPQTLTSEPTTAVPAITGAVAFAQSLGKNALIQQGSAENNVQSNLLTQSAQGAEPQVPITDLIQQGLRQQSLVQNQPLSTQTQATGLSQESVKIAATQLGNQPQQELDADINTTLDSVAKPLFQQVEHTPIKVGETPQANAESADFEQEMAKPILKSLEQGSQTLEIKLAPAHLGSVTVTLTQTPEGALQVVLVTATDKTARLLSEHAGGLTNLLRAGTQANIQIEVQQSEQGQYNQEDHQHQGQRDPREQEQRQQNRQHTSDNFLQQLRLGLLPFSAEAV